jgi:hypothetical protein
MTAVPARAAVLASHPASRSHAVGTVRVQVSRNAKGRLALTYSLEGDPARLRIPPPREPRIAERLWEHTCCEVFVARAGLPAYHEFNFAPSGEWAAYAFARYRDGAALADAALDPGIVVRTRPEGLSLDASIDLELLSPGLAGARLALALSAVVEDEAGALSWWALKHPPGKPDFHHPDGFALVLDEVRR